MPTKHPSDLDVVYSRLKALAVGAAGTDYRIPALWNCWGYDQARKAGRREIAVNPYGFAVQCLERVILPARGRRQLARRSRSRILGVRRQDGGKVLDGESQRRGGDWICSANVYGLLIRAIAAWDHDGDGVLNPPDKTGRSDSVRPSAWTETGTFAKAILLLPLLAQLGIDTIYLLPVTKIGRSFRKGEIGCPYSARNFFEFDPELHERLLDGWGTVRACNSEDDLEGRRFSRHPRRPRGADATAAASSRRVHIARGGAMPRISVEVQFGAFVEAAHAMGMRVMIDLAPRTAARDSDLILDHPDWFYWIDARRVREYGPPRLEGVPRGIPAPSDLRGILAREVMQRHLSLFRFAPNVTDPRGWRRFAERCRNEEREAEHLHFDERCEKGFSHQHQHHEPEHESGFHPPGLLRGIIREFGVVTPPGFSDVVNDPQPPWSDVTFLRLFLDHPVASARHLLDPARQPPYVFADTIKASRFPGRRPNLPLWRFLAGILPFYQRFGIDGARVDMGHALPPGLQRMIIERPKRTDPDFCFLAEELDHRGAPAARRDGYNAIIGSSWLMEPQHAEGQLHEFVYEILPAAPLPAFASAETPDTPRAAVRDGGPAFARLIGVLNNFLPSAFPFVHSGLELLERQPLNLGLDLLPRGQYVLPRRDPYYGKLGYFDRVALHWGNAGAADMVELLARAAAIRRAFIADLIDTRNYFAPHVSTNRRWIIAVGWRVRRLREANAEWRVENGEWGKEPIEWHAALGKTAALLVVANIDFSGERRCTIADPGCEPVATCRTLLTTSRREAAPEITSNGVRVVLAPGEIKVLLCGV